MKMTVKEAQERFGREVIEKFADMPAEPTSRMIYPAYEPEHDGMDEFETGSINVEGGSISAYYFQPTGAEEWEYGVMNGHEYGDIEYIEFIENID